VAWCLVKRRENFTFTLWTIVSLMLYRLQAEFQAHVVDITVCIQEISWHYYGITIFKHCPLSK